MCWLVIYGQETILKNSFMLAIRLLRVFVYLGSHFGGEMTHSKHKYWSEFGRGSLPQAEELGGSSRHVTWVSLTYATVL